MSTPTPSTAAERIGMFKLTWPHVRSELVRHWRVIALLVVISVLLGVVPTIKSELEAGLIDEIGGAITNRASIIRGAAYSSSFRYAVQSVLRLPLSRFEHGRPEDGIPERIAGVLFGGVGIGVALLIFLVLSAAAYAVDFFYYGFAEARAELTLAHI